MQHLGRIWHGPQNQPSREKVTQGGLPNGNEEESHEESRQEEKAVTVPARHRPRFPFAQHMASALAVRGGLSLCAGLSPRRITDGPPASDRKCRSSAAAATAAPATSGAR